MEPPLPMLGATEPVAQAVAVLEDDDALLVLDDGKPVGRADPAGSAQRHRLAGTPESSVVRGSPSD